MSAEKYQAWIEERYPDYARSAGECAQACKAMKEAFPELEVTNGFVTVLDYPEPRQHWWCKTANGTIVDPTKKQYPFILDYEEIDEAHPARNYPQARCHQCGEHYYETPELNGTMHTKTCEREYTEYLMEGLRGRP